MKKKQTILLTSFLCLFLVGCDLSFSVDTAKNSSSNLSFSVKEESSSKIESISKLESSTKVDSYSSKKESSSTCDSSSKETSSSSLSTSSSSKQESTSKVDSSSSKESSSNLSSSVSSESSSSTTSVSSSSSIVSKDQQLGEISLDSDCGVYYTTLAKEITYGDYNFEVANTSNYEEGYVTINKGGYILNTTAFGDIDSFKVEFEIASVKSSEVQSNLGFGGLYYVTDTHKITNPRSYSKLSVTNDKLVSLNDNPNYIAFYTYNRVNIKSITINYNQSASYNETFSNFDINLFATNDIHGQVNADDTHAGLVNASGYIENNKSKYNILLDQGDIYQGSLACYLTKGHIMDDYLLTNGYDSTILGNHEWDWDEPNIVSHIEYSPLVKLLACNVRYKDGSTPSWVQNYYICERGGVKFGIIGAIGDILGDISADMVENIKFLTGTTLTNMILQFSDELKTLGCDYIILQIHEGSSFNTTPTNGTNVNYSEVDYSKLQGKVNFVLESHTHRAYYHEDSYGISHMQCGGYLSALGHVVLSVTFNDNKPTVSVSSHNNISASILKKCVSSDFSEINNWYSANVYKEESEKVVATLPTALQEDTINQLAADSYYALKDRYSELANYDIAVAGGYIVCRSPKKLDVGDATMSDITNLFPFDNQMYLVKMKGKDLQYNFLRDFYYLSGELNASSKTNFNSYYYVIMDSYNYFYLTKQRTPYNEITIEYNLTEKYGIYPRDVFAMYLNDLYPAGALLMANVTNDKIDFNSSSCVFEVNSNVSVTATYTNITNYPNYNEFIVGKNTGSIIFTCSSGYIISKVEFKQYAYSSSTINKGLTLYSDASSSKEISYSLSGTGTQVYSVTNNTNTFVVKNVSSSNVMLYYISITLTKDESK